MTPDEILKTVRALEIRARRLVTEAVTGAYHSSFKGRGMDFEEVREYAIGDDVRTIDWNVTARMDHPYVKVFREERELTLMLLVDLSASGSFGSVDRSKRELAAEIGGILAFSATRNNDKVGLVLYTDTVERYIPPKKGRRHVLRVIRDILAHEPRGRGTDHSGALDFLQRVQRRHGVVFVISDFLEPDPGPTIAPGAPTAAANPELTRKLMLANRRHDLVCVALSDPRERDLPDVGRITLEDAETGEVVEIDTRDKRLRANYRGAATERQAAFDQAMRRAGVDCVEASTDRPYLPALRGLFARRAHRF